MGVIELLFSASPSSGQKPIWIFEGNYQRSSRRTGKVASVNVMASTVPAAAPVNQKEETQQGQLKGDSFIRPHLLKLKPYQPILPFEVFLFSLCFLYVLVHSISFHFGVIGLPVFVYLIDNLFLMQWRKLFWVMFKQERRKFLSFASLCFFPFWCFSGLGRWGAVVRFNSFSMT